MNRYWNRFVEEVSWFLKPGQVAKVGVSESPGLWKPASGDFTRLFPDLHQLLDSASRTAVAVDDAQYQLFTWSKREPICAWLSPTPCTNPSPSLHPHHRVLLASFGGIVERSGEPDSWIRNHDDVLTEREARRDATFIKHYAWAFEEASLEIPIEMEQFYSIAAEVNGNTTLCHRMSGEVVLFAPDHHFDYVEVYPGCPEYSLYKLAGAPHFCSWVNKVARQWSENIESSV